MTKVCNLLGCPKSVLLRGISWAINHYMNSSKFTTGKAAVLSFSIGVNEADESMNDVATSAAQIGLIFVTSAGVLKLN